MLRFGDHWFFNCVFPVHAFRMFDHSLISRHCAVNDTAARLIGRHSADSDCFAVAAAAVAGLAAEAGRCWRTSVRVCLRCVKKIVFVVFVVNFTRFSVHAVSPVIADLSAASAPTQWVSLLFGSLYACRLGVIGNVVALASRCCRSRSTTGADDTRPCFDPRQVT